MADGIVYKSATTLKGMFERKELSPVELMQAVIDRTREVNPKVNAITYDYFDEALEQAKDAEKRYADGSARPLEGIPTAIKDFHPVKGKITTYGSRIFEHHTPDYTAPTVERLLNAGAILHLRTTTPEFAYSGMTHSPLWGVTRNPWNLDYTPGGSSGGAGAGLATGMTVLADGTDGGGSIRIPASTCGLVGYKPPFGRNPLDRDHPGESLLKYGPLSRTVSDAALMQNIMSGPHSEDRCTIPERLELPMDSESAPNWKIAVSLDLGYFPIDNEVEENTRRSALYFEEMGSVVDEVQLGWDWEVLVCWMTYWRSLLATAAGPALWRWRYDMDPVVVDLVETGLRHSGTDVYHSIIQKGRMYDRLRTIFEEYDFLICPTCAIPSVRADHDQLDPNFTINGRRVDPTYGWFLTNPFNMVGECPVMSVPNGTSSIGVPTGLQIVGKPYDDSTVFTAAWQHERAMNWLSEHPNI